MMRYLLLLAAAFTLPTPAIAQGDRELSTKERRAYIAALTADLVGRYEYSDRELRATLQLRADGSFDYRVKEVDAAPAGDRPHGEPPTDERLVGVWRVYPDGRVELTEPLRPSEFVQASSSVDPRVGVAVAISATGPNKDREEKFVVLIDDEAAAAIEPNSRDWSLPLAGETSPKTLEIIRLRDDRSLFRTTLAPKGPNRFSFNYSYTPRPPTAFDLSARAVDGRPGMIEVELGTASVIMTRVRD